MASTTYPQTHTPRYALRSAGALLRAPITALVLIISHRRTRQVARTLQATRLQQRLVAQAASTFLRDALRAEDRLRTQFLQGRYRTPAEAAHAFTLYQQARRQLLDGTTALPRPFQRTTPPGSATVTTPDAS